uniref:Polymerase (DNA directed) nu n=1 Tax=Salarias fasciatus TaxID=181472 RepID=A0A672GA81_SALFA
TGDPEQNSSSVPREESENINAPKNQWCHPSLNSAFPLKRKHDVTRPSEIGPTAKGSRGFREALTCDPRVKDSGKMTSDEKRQLLEKAGRFQALLLTMVYQDGTTQLHAEQKLAPPVHGLLVLMKSDLTCSGLPRDSPAPGDCLVYLRLERTPAWAQQQTLRSQDLLLQVLSSPQLVVCYKAKDFLRTVLQFYTKDLSWTQVAGCHVQDPQVSGWLLDPADSSSCFQDLLNKHCREPHKIPTVGPQKVRRQANLLTWSVCAWRMRFVCFVSAMESHHIHVDKDALKRTSDLLGTKMRQLEQEAHREAGQIFLVTSSSQLRAVLFEKLRLHERCENKKLPKTINKQQQSTSEAANYISSTWLQTSAVTGRISAKHPVSNGGPTLLHSPQDRVELSEVVTVHPRAMFVPPEGWSFLAADFCQVELRLLAHLSADPELLRIFSSPQADVFTMLASQWFGLSESEVTSGDREHAKRIVYSVVYGAGRERLSEILGVSVAQAGQFQDSFLQTYGDVQAFIQKTIQQSHKRGYVVSIMGRRRTLPNITSPVWGARMQAERQAVNFVVQGSAADFCKMAMIRIFNLISCSGSLSVRLIAQLHDELLFEVEDSQLERFGGILRPHFHGVLGVCLLNNDAQRKSKCKFLKTLHLCVELQHFSETKTQK